MRRTNVVLSRGGGLGGAWSMELGGAGPRALAKFEKILEKTIKLNSSEGSTCEDGGEDGGPGGSFAERKHSAYAGGMQKFKERD